MNTRTDTLYEGNGPVEPHEMKERIVTLQDRLQSNAHWLLRIGMASVFVYHGILEFSNLDGFADMLPVSFMVLLMLYLVITGNAGIRSQARTAAAANFP